MLRFFCTILFIFFYSYVSGQVYIGPKFGAQLSYAIWENKSNRERFNRQPILGFNAGGVVAFEIKKRFYLQTELLYSRKGKNVTGVIDPDLDNDIIYHHIDLPVLFKTDFKSNIGKGKYIRWYANVGPNVSYWLSGNGEIINTDVLDFGPESLTYDIFFGNIDDYEGETAVMVIPEANRWQLGLNLGGGMVFDIYGRWLMLDFRYEFGHTFVGRGEAGRIFFDSQGGGELVGYFDDLKARNAGVRISVAYLFNTKLEEKNKGKSTINNKSRSKVKRRKR